MFFEYASNCSRTDETLFQVSCSASMFVKQCQLEYKDAIQVTQNERLGRILGLPKPTQSTSFGPLSHDTNTSFTVWSICSNEIESSAFLLQPVFHHGYWIMTPNHEFSMHLPWIIYKYLWLIHGLPMNYRCIMMEHGKSSAPHCIVALRWCVISPCWRHPLLWRYWLFGPVRSGLGSP